MPGGCSPINALTRAQATRPGEPAARRGRRPAGLRRPAQLASLPPRDAGRDGGPGSSAGPGDHPVAAAHRGVLGALHGRRGDGAREDAGRAGGGLRARRGDVVPRSSRRGRSGGGGAPGGAGGRAPLDAHDLHRPQRAGGHGRALAVRRRLRAGRPRRRRGARRIRASPSPTRAGAAAPASPGSSPTSTMCCAAWPPTARSTRWSCPSASCATTWKSSTISTSRRAAWPSGTGWCSTAPGP